MSALDFTSPLPFSSTSKKSTFRPIKFNQNPKTHQPSHDVTATEKISSEKPLNMPGTEKRKTDTHGLDAATAAEPVVAVENFFQAPTVEKRNGMQSENAVTPSDKTTSDHSILIPNVMKENENSQCQDSETFQENAPENSPADSLSKEPTHTHGARVEFNNPEIIPEVEVLTEANSLTTCAEVEFKPAEEQFKLQNDDKRVEEFLLKLDETNHVIAPDDISPSPEGNSCRVTSSSPSDQQLPTLESLKTDKPSNSKLDTLTRGESCDSVTSEGGGERPYTDDDIDDTESIENFLETCETNGKKELSVDENAVQSSQVNSSTPDSTLLHTNKSTAISDINMLESEGTMKPTSEDFVLPPPPASDEEIFTSQASFRVTSPSTQERQEVTIQAPSWSSDPSDFPLPPPPEDLPSPISPSSSGSTTPSFLSAQAEKPKGFRSVTRPVSKKPSSPSSLVREETTTNYSLQGKAFPISHADDVSVTPQEQLPQGAVYQTTTKEGEVVHTDTYYPAGDQDDPKSVVLERTKTTTVVQAPHHEGIGPVNESGVPVALKSSVDDSKHWYKNMFKQMHKVETNEDTTSATTDTRSHSTNSSLPRHTSTEISKPKKVGRITDYQPAQPYVVENEPDSANEEPPAPPQQVSRVKSTLTVAAPKPTSPNSYSPSYFTSSKTQSEEKMAPEPKRVVPTRTNKPTTKTQHKKAPDDEMRLPARGKYDFIAQTAKEYAVKKGQTVIITKQVDSNWYMVQSVDGSKSGIVPVSYVEVISGTTPEKPLRNGQARAKFNYEGGTKNELSFKKGDEIVLLKRVDQNWYRGKLAGVVGILPAVYVEVLMEPETESKKSVPAAKQSTPHIVQSHSRQSSALSQSSSDEPDERERKQRAAFLANSVVQTTTPLHMRDSSTHRENVIDMVMLDGASKMAEEESRKQSSQLPNAHDNSKFVNFGELDQVVEALSSGNQQLPTLHPSETTNNNLSVPGKALTPSIPSYPSSSSTVSPQSTSPRPASPTTVDYGQVIGTYLALYVYEANNEDELDLVPGDVVKVVETCDDGWYVGTCQRTGVFGTFPGNYVAPTQT